MTEMAPSTSLQRFEVKYLIDEFLASKITGFCRANLDLDPYSATQPNYQYPIHSIYLDSQDYTLARSVLERRPERFKLRVRTYRSTSESNSNRPAFFEVKRKKNDIIYKSRTRLTRAEADGLLWGASNPLGRVGQSTPSTTEGLNKFQWLRQKIQAQPTLSVSYTREAYENRIGSKTRLSFDRNLCYGLMEYSADGCHEVCRPVRLPGVIFEVKFTDTYPAWLGNLVAEADLTRRGVCKYLMCVQIAKKLFLSNKAGAL